MNHLMVDLETMGNGPYAPVISIGAVFFDPNTGETGEEFSVNISLESSMRYRARPDASTILWWLEQSEEARKSLTSNTLNRPGFPGECFICELRLPDHRFRWKH
ncbi:3'-5' exonuclease, partial [Escherichia coli]|uniref:3'-5' exonuclease n=1 Tax=Escherichia coli TaxID=562 RepID=UPI00202BB40D